jgi:hypothetical protein
MFRYLSKNIALRKTSPDRISMSMPGCADNNFYSLFIEVPEYGFKMLCKKEHKHGYEGFLWVNKKEGLNACLLKSELEDVKYTLKIDHYYKGWVFEYSSPFLFIIHTLFQKHKFLYRKDKLEQTIFNNKQLVRSDRIELLEYILEQTNIKPDYITSPLSLGMEMYSRRWFYHPDRESMKNHYKLLFESLAESKDLKKIDYSYKLDPKALITISEYERDEQKHLDSQNSARKTRDLTKVIIFLGLANLGFHVCKWAHENGMFL